MTSHPELALSLRRELEPLSEPLAQLVARPLEQGTLSFDQVEAPGALDEVKRFRLEQYRRALPYMLDELEPDGSDDLDPRSCTFVARWNGDVVATIRLTPHPFETSRYVPEDVVAGFLGPGWRDDYVEWSRLLVDKAAPVRGLASSVIVFSGMRTFATTAFRGFFGYATTQVQRVFARFGVATHPETFTIPRRGPQRYVLLKGNFMETFDQFTSRMHQEDKTCLKPSMPSFVPESTGCSTG